MQVVRSRLLIGAWWQGEPGKVELGSRRYVCSRVVRGKYAKLPNVVVSSVPGAQRRVCAAKAVREPKGAARLRRAEGARLYVGLHPACLGTPSGNGWCF